MRLRIRRKVDLPHPDGPIRAVTVPGGMESDTRLRTRLVPNQADTLTASSRAPVMPVISCGLEPRDSGPISSIADKPAPSPLPGESFRMREMLEGRPDRPM